MVMHFIAKNEGFICQNCKKQVDPVKYGGSYRNHCPFCLYSKHVDGEIPGDRKGTCRGLMKPIGVFTRRTGEYVLVHKCVKCGFERYNRIAGDDDFEKIIKLSSRGVMHYAPTKSIKFQKQSLSG